MIGEHQFGLLVRESTAFTARDEKHDYECILAEDDATSDTFKNAPDVGNLTSAKNPDAMVKYLNVMGNEYSDKKNFDLRPRPDEKTHMTLAESIHARVTPEAAERLQCQNEQFTDVVYKLLRLIQPFSYQQ